MRQILFRGKRIDNGEWVEGGYKSIDSQIFIIAKQGNILDFNHEIIPETVSQFTGLLDKNGKKIFEGDIIQYKHYYASIRWWSNTEEIPQIEEQTEMQRNNFSLKRDVIVFKDGCFKVGYELTLIDVDRGYKFKKGQTYSCNFEEKYWDFEIIGNTHDRPELIN